jgi:hypothetical protein
MLWPTKPAQARIPNASAESSSENLNRQVSPATVAMLTALPRRALAECVLIGFNLFVELAVQLDRSHNPPQE